MEKFINGRLPSRTVLDELRPYLPDVDRDATPAARAFVALDWAVAAHAEVLDRLDGTGRRLIVARMVVKAVEGDGRKDSVRGTDRAQAAGRGIETLWGARTGAGSSIQLRISRESVHRPRGAGAPPLRSGRRSD